MLILIFAAIIAICLSLSRRKFGVFMLTLLAGSVLNNYWNKPIADFLTTASLNIPFATLSGVVGMVLICAPAIMILGKSSKDDNWITGVVNSILTTIFMVLIVLPSFSNVFTLDAFSADIARILVAQGAWIILVGFGLAILDVLAFKIKK